MTAKACPTCDPAVSEATAQGAASQVPNRAPNRAQASKPAGVVAGLLLALIWLYQKLISPLLGTRCRFYPSCSAYAKTCLTTMSLGKALIKTTKRLSRCHPGHPGGVDLP